MSEFDDELLERPKTDSDLDVPILSRVVKPSKQKDLADLLIKIIETNEADDQEALQRFDADVSSATLRDIDAKLSEALQHTKGAGKAKAGDEIPMLTTVADFSLEEELLLSDKAANTEARDSANQEFPTVNRFSLVEGDGDRDSAQATSGLEFDLGLDTSQLSANQRSLLEQQLQQSTRQLVDELIDRHAEAIRAELEQRLDALRETLLLEASDRFDVDPG